MRSILILYCFFISLSSYSLGKRIDYRNKIIFQSAFKSNVFVEVYDNKFLRIKNENGSENSSVVLEFKQFSLGKSGGYVYSYYTHGLKGVERIQIYDLREVSSRKRYKEYDTRSEIVIAFWYAKGHYKQGEKYSKLHLNFIEGRFRTPKKRYRELDEVTFDYMLSREDKRVFKLIENNKLSIVSPNKEDVMFLDYQGATKDFGGKISNFHYKVLGNIDGIKEIIMSDLRALTVKEKFDTFKLNEDFKLTIVYKDKKQEILMSSVTGLFNEGYTKKYHKIDERIELSGGVKSVMIFKIPTEKNMSLLLADETIFTIFKGKNIVSQYTGFSYLKSKDLDGVIMSFFEQDVKEYNITLINVSKVSKKLRLEFFGNNYEKNIIISKTEKSDKESIKYPLKLISSISL